MPVVFRQPGHAIAVTVEPYRFLRLTSAACGHAGAAGQAGDVAGDVAGVHAGAAGQAGDVAGLHADGRTRGGMLLRSASVSPGAGAPHRTPTWPCPDTWRAAGRWIETGIRGQEAAGMFWKSEAEGPRPADVSVPRGGHVAGIGARGRRVGGPVAGRRGRRRFDQRPAPHPRIKEC